MKRKLLSVLLVLVMLFASFTQVSYAAFSDTTGHWAKTAIEKWSDMGFIAGSGGKFRPDDKIKRCDTAIILSNLFGLHNAGKNTFTDVPANAYYEQAVLKVKNSGILTGKGADKFAPEDSLTRQEAACILCSILNIPASDSCNTSFKDSASIASWAKGSVNAIVNAGYMMGSSGEFRPLNNITRAEFVTVFNNAFKEIISSGEFTGDVKGTVLVNGSAVLKNCTIDGDLLISEGAEGGKVVLDNVVVKGRIISRCGVESLEIIGKTEAEQVVIHSDHKIPDKNPVNPADPSDPEEGKGGHWEYVIDIEATKELLESALSESIKEEYPTVYIAIDCFTIGADKFILAPVKEQVRPGTTAAQLLAKEWGERNMKYTGKLSGSFYLHSISGIESGIIPDTLDIADLPACLAAAAGSILKDGMAKNNEDEDVLGEFDYTLQSGWMYSVNGHYPNVGMGDYPLEDGDVVRVSFTLCGLGADIGGGYSAGGMSSANYYTYNHLTKEIKDCAEGKGSLGDLITAAKKLKK